MRRSIYFREISSHAARLLGIHRPQLSNLLKKYSLKREVFER